jgi:hypothetical protein
VLAVLAAWGVATNLALALEYQRLIAPAREADRLAFVELQYDLDGTTRVSRVGGEDALLVSPDPEDRGQVVLVDGCRLGIYWTDGFTWTQLDDDELCEKLDARLSGE